VGLVWSCLAVVYPLLNGLILLPRVVPGEGLDAGQVRVAVEDLVFLLQDLKGLLSGLVFVGGSLKFLQEGLLADDRFVLFDDIRVSSREALI
jgi:hypothetical protein